MLEPRPVFKRNGDLVWMDAKLGVWTMDKLGGRDASGNRLVDRIWHIYTIAGGHFIGFSRAECVAYINRQIHNILVARRTLSEEQQQLNINNA
jgi:hypothetical protein